MKAAILALVTTGALLVSTATADARPPHYSYGGGWHGARAYPHYYGGYSGYRPYYSGYYPYSGFSLNVGGLGLGIGNSYAYPYYGGGYYSTPYYGNRYYGGSRWY